MGWPSPWVLSAQRGSQHHELTKPFFPAVGTASPVPGLGGVGGCQLSNWPALHRISPLPPSSPQSLPKTGFCTVRSPFHLQRKEGGSGFA